MIKDNKFEDNFLTLNEENKNSDIPVDFYENIPPDRISIAPMLNITNRHFRFLIRLITKKTYLYTEMINSNTILYNERELEYEYDFENPVVLQLGGNDENELSKSAEIANKYNYDEININCGCPSNKVQNHNFGACLMKNPKLVKSCVIAIKKVTNKPVTVKCRLGLDKYCRNFLDDFISNIIEEVEGKSYCDHIILHSRIALMNIDTVKNRTVPPLMYEEARRIKFKYPKIKITINGGFITKKQILDELTRDIIENDIIDICKNNDSNNKNNNHNCIDLLSNESIKNEDKSYNENAIHNNLKENDNKFNTKRNKDKIRIDCVMIGREAYNNPFLFADFDSTFYNVKNIGFNREEILKKYAKYCQREYEKFVLPSILLKPIINLFHGEKHNCFYRNKIFEFKKTFKEMNELKNKSNTCENNIELVIDSSIEIHILNVLEEFKKLNPEACLKSY